MTDEIETTLERATERREERDSVLRKLEALQVQLAETQKRVDETRTLLADEESDVAKLESFSPTRILATLKGSRLTDLDREAAERDAARYRVAEAEARHNALERDEAGYQAELNGFADVDQVYAAALEAKERWLHSSGSSAAPRLAEISERRGYLTARDKELREAHAAGVTASQWLGEAEQKFGAARSWSSWDSFGGGGMLTDMMKYDRLDEANSALHHCNGALSVLSRELADVGMAAVAGVELDGLTRGLDVWFDNIFSDMSVRSRIVDAHERVRHLQQVVADLVVRLSQDGQQVLAESAALSAERESLLTA